MIVLIFFPYILLLFAQVNNACISCNWINSSDEKSKIQSTSEPTMAIAFLHTRKSGGTSFHGVLGRWLAQMGCASNDLRNVGVNVIERGIVDGKFAKYHNENRIITCPNINFLSWESSCWDPRRISMLPAKGLRNDAPLVLFTILRDPIDRIGSQAFYSQDVVGTKTIIQFILKQCLVYIKTMSNQNKHSDDQNSYDGYEKCRNMQSKNSIPIAMNDSCNCMFEAYHMALHELKTNEQIWYDWFNYSNSQSGWYLNFYKRNYFLERIVGGRNSLQNPQSHKQFQYALNCLNNHGCDSNIEYEKLNVFEELSSMYQCYRNNHKSPITRSSLELAQKLLLTHIDFIIMENYTQPSTAGAIASILNANKSNIAQLIKLQYHGISKMSPSQSYRNLMPPAIVKYLELDNELDIELYRYAILVFRERAENGYWDDIEDKLQRYSNNDD